MRGTSGIARIAALGLVGSMILSACVAQAGALIQGNEDTSYDQVERARSQIGSPDTPDTSYDQVEQARSQIGSPATPDTSYDQVEQARSQIGAAATPDTSYDQVERARAGAFGQ